MERMTIAKRNEILRGMAFETVIKEGLLGDKLLKVAGSKFMINVEFEGETYPVVKIEISSTSHPFYTGKSKLVDTAGRVDKFMSRYGKAAKK